MRLLLAVVLAASAACGMVRAQDAGGPPGEAVEPMPPANWLFVQVGTGFASDGKTLTIDGISPTTLMFSDRPERMTGDAPTARFVDFWTQGSDDFQKDPPNASLSFAVDGKPSVAVVELVNPRLDGGKLVYDIRPLEGTIPASGGDISLFIDWWYGPGWHHGWGWRPVPVPVPVPEPAYEGGRCWRGAYGHLHCRPWWAD